MLGHSMSPAGLKGAVEEIGPSQKGEGGRLGPWDAAFSGGGESRLLWELNLEVYFCN